MTTTTANILKTRRTAFYSRMINLWDHVGCLIRVATGQDLRIELGDDDDDQDVIVRGFDAPFRPRYGLCALDTNEPAFSIAARFLASYPG